MFAYKELTQGSPEGQAMLYLFQDSVVAAFDALHAVKIRQWLPTLGYSKEEYSAISAILPAEKDFQFNLTELTMNPHNRSWPYQGNVLLESGILRLSLKPPSIDFFIDLPNSRFNCFIFVETDRCALPATQGEMARRMFVGPDPTPGLAAAISLIEYFHHAMFGNNGYFIDPEHQTDIVVKLADQGSQGYQVRTVTVDGRRTQVIVARYNIPRRFLNQK